MLKASQRPPSRCVWLARALLLGSAIALGCLRGVPASAAAAPPLYRAAFTGTVVQFGLSGFEPDFDAIDRVVISATLHDTRRAGLALPDAHLVLSAYLENFQPDTTPVLPDLLHPNQTATSLGGFLSGKAALLNNAGRLRYKGSLLAETFLDNSAHVVIDVQPTGAPATAPVLRLEGIFTLYKAGTTLNVHGEMHAIRRLLASERASLRVPHGRAPSWQSVIAGLSVHIPTMMGTAGAARPTAAPAPRPRTGGVPRLSVRAVALGGMVIALAIILIVLWRQRGLPPESPPAGSTRNESC